MSKTTLKEMTVKIGSGATPRGGKNVYDSQGVAFIRSQNVLDFYFSNNGLAFINEKQAEELNNVTVVEDDVLLNITGDSIARVCVAPKEILPARVSQHVAIIRCKKEISSQYILYYLLYLKPYLLKICGVGGTRNALTKDVIEKLEIENPSKEKQQRIAAVLSTLDAKIELNYRINAEVEAMAKTLYDYWFVQFDFPNKNGKPYKSSGGKMVWSAELKREIPEGWDLSTASQLFTFNPSLSFSKNSMGSYIDMSAIPITGFMTDEIQKKEYNGGVKFQNGDVVIARITPCLENGKTGMITMLEKDEIGFGSTEFIVLRGKKMKLSCFAACLARSSLFRKFAIANMLGTSGRKRIEAKTLETFRMAIPPANLLFKFEEIVSPYFESSTINTKQNQQISSLRDWLLPMLMNGQVKVG